MFAFNCCAPGRIPLLLLQPEQRAQDLGAWPSLPGWAKHTACTSLRAQSEDFLPKCLSKSYARQLKELLPFYTVNRSLDFCITGRLCKYTETEVYWAVGNGCTASVWVKTLGISVSSPSTTSKLHLPAQTLQVWLCHGSLQDEHLLVGFFRCADLQRPWISSHEAPVRELQLQQR